ncbi:MAG: hypothetical protein MI864_07645 [Pseudomonadales bacterium]|nr:hypothetical protein [Pseudomonadales bacterium]
MGAIVIPGAVSIAGVHNVFSDSGVVDTAAESALQGVATGMLGFLKEYVCPKYVLEHAGLEDSVRGEGLPAWVASL